MQFDIGVVGNGTVGKVAALAFAQSGFRVALLCPTELSITKKKFAAELNEWDARVFALNHTAKNLLTKLKVWDAMDMQRIAPIESMKIVDVGGASGKLSLDAYTAYQQQLAWIVEDQNINQAVDAALSFAPNMTKITATTAAISSDFSEITLTNGHKLSAELWVGADGAQSWLRHQANIGLDYRSYQQRGVVANFATAKPHHGIAYQWFAGEQGIIALLPLPGQRVSLVWSAPDELAHVLLMEDSYQLARRVVCYCEKVFGELTPLPPGDVQAFPLHFIRPHSIVSQRIALVGDAAHVVHPLAGHGLNLGFGDIVALLAALTQRETWRSCADPRVLQRYARMRKEDILLMQLVTDGLARLFSSSQKPIQTIRGIGMNLVNSLTFLKRQLIQQAMGKTS